MNLNVTLYDSENDTVSILPISKIEPESDSFVSAKTDIVTTSDHPATVKVKFSDVRNDGEDFLLIDTIVPLLIDRR